METDAGTPTGLVCMQWTCNASCTSSNCSELKGTIDSSMRGHLSSKDLSLPNQGKDGLYPTRTGVILLGPHAVVEGELAMQGKQGQVKWRDPSIMILLRLNAATAAKLKRAASQLKVGTGIGTSFRILERPWIHPALGGFTPYKRPVGCTSRTLTSSTLLLASLTPCCPPRYVVFSLLRLCR